jgi:AmmeMemoRadiSam system protein B
MNYRDMLLDIGWYAQNKEDMNRWINFWLEEYHPSPLESQAAVLPHAGWYYSGSYAYQYFSNLTKKPDLIVILGGHLSSQHDLMLWDYEYVKTPFGTIPIQKNITAYIKNRWECRQDRSNDNSIEIHLPFISWLWKEVPIVALRIPPNKKYLNMADYLSEWIDSFAKNPLIIASTDMTHFGDVYGFYPDLHGLTPDQWVRENDNIFINEIIKGDPQSLLKVASSMANACSSGAVALAMEIEKKRNRFNPHLIRQGNSLKRKTSSSMVGYALIDLG